MAGLVEQGGDVPGYSVPVHRALTEHILLGGAPRGLAILNRTLAAALGLGLDGDYRVVPAVSDGGDIPPVLNLTGDIR